MASRLRVGVQTPCVAPLRLERMSMRLATLAGADSLLLPDHYVSFVPRLVWAPEHTPAARVLPSPDAYFDPFVMLGNMAARFRRVRIGTGVTEAFRRHPVTLAQAFVTIDHLTGGRAILGIGNGERENTAPYGLPFTRRVARLAEALEIMRRCWASGGEPIDFDGRFWTLRKAIFATPLHAGRPPCTWVASHAPKMLGLTGRYADGWYPTLKLTPADYRARLDDVLAAGRAAGRDMSGFEPALQIQVALGSCRADVLAAMARSKVSGALSMLLPGTLWARHGLRHPLGEAFEGFADFVPEEVLPEQIADAQRHATPALLGDGVFAGSVADIAAEVEPLAQAGLRHLVMWNVGPVITGPTAADVVRQALLVRRLRRIAIRT